jgi:hypothetical protein
MAALNIACDGMGWTTVLLPSCHGAAVQNISTALYRIATVDASLRVYALSTSSV